ncbi:MAG: PrgI family protein [Candidatus Paceibacterota bacterium]
MQFQVPQYYEVKERIVGPLTLQQFFYIAAACGLSFLLFFIFQLWLWFVVSVILVGTASALALIEINGQSLTKVLFSALFYYWRPRVYFWQREIEKEEIILPEEKEQIKEIKKELGFQQKIKSLGQKIITSRLPLPREKSAGPNIRERYQVFRKSTGEKQAAKRVDYR